MYAYIQVVLPFGSGSSWLRLDLAIWLAHTWSHGSNPGGPIGKISPGVISGSPWQPWYHPWQPTDHCTWDSPDRQPSTLTSKVVHPKEQYSAIGHLICQFILNQSPASWVLPTHTLLSRQWEASTKRKSTTYWLFLWLHCISTGSAYTLSLGFFVIATWKPLV